MSDNTAFSDKFATLVTLYNGLVIDLRTQLSIFVLEPVKALHYVVKRRGAYSRLERDDA
jgi:hypothetical protein